MNPVNVIYRYQHLLLLIVLIITAMTYSPALDSQFMQDDYPNLNTLELVESKGYSYFIFGGESGPAKRPISMFSFALQHEDWPGNPYAFKLWNLIIHLVNGVLIYLICLHLARYIAMNRATAVGFSLVVAGLWILHPIHLSTVLYVVQRMTLLAGLFTLTGIVAYLCARERFVAGHHHTHLMMGIAVTLFTVCAILSKEIGILLPLFIIVLESTLLISSDKQPGRIFKSVFLYLPLVLLAIYLGYNFDNIKQGYEIRHFTMSERLLTQAAVLFDYIYSILIPTPDKFSFYHEDFPVSTGLTSPLYTIFAIGGLLSLLIIAFVTRKVLPVLAFSLFWYLAGHSLESSFLNLELYFEHRNYLPAFGVIFLLVWVIFTVIQKTDMKIISLGFPVAYIILMLISLNMNISLWSNSGLQAKMWANIHPGSLRAQTHLVDYYVNTGEYDKALILNDQVKYISNTGDTAFYPNLKKIHIKACLMEEAIQEHEWQKIMREAEATSGLPRIALSILDATTFMVILGGCKSLDLYKYTQTILILVNNTSYKRYSGKLHEIMALLSLQAGDYQAALNNIYRSLDDREKPQRYEILLTILVHMNRRDEAKEALMAFHDYLKIRPAIYLAYREIYEKYDNKITSLRY